MKYRKRNQNLFFPKQIRKLISNPLDIDNPITVQILGVCSALAVTTQMKPAFVMSLGLTIVTASSNVVISHDAQFYTLAYPHHRPIGGRFTLGYSCGPAS